MHPKQFKSENAVRAYAEPKGLVCLIDDNFVKWQQQLSPEQYELVDVRSKGGVKQALLLPKAILKAAWQADPLRKALLG
jgi:hypothetical protein